MTTARMYQQSSFVMRSASAKASGLAPEPLPGVRRANPRIRERITRDRGTGLIQAEVTFPDGTMTSKKFKERWEAEDWVDVQRSHSLATGGPHDSLQFGDWIELWLDTHQVSTSTLATYRSLYRCHFEPIREIPLTQLTVPMCRHFMDDLELKLKARKPPSGQPYTLRAAYMFLRVSMRAAYEQGLIAWNPVTVIRKPGRVPRTLKHLTVEDARALLDSIDGSEDPRALAVHLMLRLGLRRGEALGLRWEDVDLERGTISVSNQLRRMPFEDPTDRRLSDLKLIKPKTPYAARVLVVGDDLLDELVRRASSYGRFGPSGYVICGADGTPLCPDSVSKWVSELGATLGFKCTPHRLRHTAATILLNEGASVEVVAQVLGHVDIRTTLLYARLLDSHTGPALDLIGNALGR